MTDDQPTGPGPEPGDPSATPPPPAATPPSPPAAPPPVWNPPGGPDEPPTVTSNPTVAVPPVPPPGYPPAPPTTPGYAPSPGAVQPNYGQPNYGQPNYGQPPQAPPAYGVPVGVVAAPPAPKKKRTGLVLGILALVLLAVIAGIGAFVVVGGNSGSDLVASVDRCVIAADGTLSASGTLRNRGGNQQRARMTVVFNNTSGGSRVDRSTLNVTVRADGSANWEAGGRAGDRVQRVTCVVSEVTTQ